MSASTVCSVATVKGCEHAAHLATRNAKHRPSIVLFPMLRSTHCKPPAPNQCSTGAGQQERRTLTAVEARPSTLTCPLASYEATTVAGLRSQGRRGGSAT